MGSEYEWRGLTQRVPRHFFIAEYFRADAYKDCAIPIGHGVTASRPSTIAKMLGLLGRQERVLEIGTGCGWQTALLTKFSTEVFSIEYVPELHERAARDLRDFSVRLKQGDGREGWPEHAPFTGIISAFCMESIPQTIIDQMTIGGVFVGPIGDAGRQEIVRAEKTARGMIHTHHGPCGFSLAAAP